jgi:hypothetical protein
VGTLRRALEEVRVVDALGDDMTALRVSVCANRGDWPCGEKRCEVGGENMPQIGDVGRAQRKGSEVANGRSAGACIPRWSSRRRSAAAGGALCGASCVGDARATTVVVMCKAVSGCCATQRRAAGALKCHGDTEWSDGALFVKARGAKSFFWRGTCPALMPSVS